MAKQTASSAIIAYAKAIFPKSFKPYNTFIQNEINKVYRPDGSKSLGDIPRATRMLCSQGFLERVGGPKSGIYIFCEKKESNNGSAFSSCLRSAILKRDNHTCVVCGLEDKSGKSLCVDHIVPFSKGGKATESNGQTLCITCNNKKKDKSNAEFLAEKINSLLERLDDMTEEDRQKFNQSIDKDRISKLLG